MDFQAQIRSALSEGKLDDVSFDSIFLGAREMTGVSTDIPDIERAIMVVEELLRRGFTPLNNGPDEIWGAPWEEKTEAEIIARIRREFDQLTEEPSFLDICWFRAPRDAA